MTIYRISKDNPSTVFIILDTSVKNDITISVIYIQKKQALITKAIYYTINVILVPWTSSYILYGLPLHQKGNISKATC